ncbi:MAG: RNA-binding protein [Gammaproteobacteria bacterium]|nr:RNA-binding protein [Gammaproteobacteria bacterium]
MSPVYRYHAMTRMVVRNLAPNTTAEALNSMFAEHGAVHSVKLITDVMTGRCGGVAYVTIDERVTGAARDALDGSRHEGRVIEVSIEKKSVWTVGQGNSTASR